MAAISADDIDRAVYTFCYEVSDRATPMGRMQHHKLLPWVFVQFPDSGDPRYVAPMSGNRSVGLTALTSQPYVAGAEYMRSSPFPHEADLGSPEAGTDEVKAGPKAIHFFGGV